MNLIEQRRAEQNRQLVVMALKECADMTFAQILKELENDEELLDAMMGMSPNELSQGLSAVGLERPVDDRPKARGAKKSPRKATALDTEADDQPEEASVDHADKAPKKKRSTRKKSARPEVDAPELGFNLRTEEGRDQYDAVVAKALRSIGAKVSASELRSVVGGSPAQVRASLDRLIDQGRVEYEGKTRSTRYMLAG